MASTIELDLGTLKALKESDTYSIENRYGVYVALQNPWKAPTDVQERGSTVASLANEDDWLVAPSGFFGTPRLEVYTASEWQKVSKLQESILEPEVTPIVDISSIPDYSEDPVAAKTDGRYHSVDTRAEAGYGLALAGVTLPIFAPLVGLILSIVARVKGVRAGAQPTIKLATIGIVVNSVVLFLFSLLLISIISSAANQNSLDDGPKNGDIAPAWWDEESANVLEVANRVQPNFRATQTQDTCVNYGLENTYSVDDTVPPGDLARLAEEYRAGFEKLYPEAEVTVSSTRDTGTELKYFEVKAAAVYDDSYDYVTPEARVIIRGEGSQLITYAYCD